MSNSEEYRAYQFKIYMLAACMGIFSVVGAGMAVAMRLFFMRKLHKSLVRAAINMQSAGQILKRRVLEPSTLAIIAHERNGIDEKEVCDEYESIFRKPLKLCANLFGFDSVTKDFVKYYDSKFLNEKKSKKGGKKKRKEGKKSKK